MEYMEPRYEALYVLAIKGQSEKIENIQTMCDAVGF
jgi:hypothetical protein